ncbi:MAG: filamentous hemagglutinin family protein, partial [Proteobacteria bacterium]|nr:filamentous hemagglutinin family protein [Pseudomonadota bacterium]MBU1547896.1 filamentous hemagglutinin family protein [Pseudomonadota bacterium]
MKKRYPGLSKQMMILGLCLQTTLATEAVAAPTIPGYYGDVSKIIPPSPTAVPTGGQVVRGSASISDTDYGKLVEQESSKVVIHWQSYDLGETRTMRYNQQSKEWAALNVVKGDGYSKIFGTIEAQGRVYLLNQNGILFGPSSRINVHSLTASALNLDEAQFYSGPEFADAGSEVYAYQAGAPIDATVANYGAIKAGNLGSVFLLGPQVENHGAIEAPGGDIGLLAGGSITLSQSTDGKTATNEFNATVAAGATPGIATNFEGGSLLSDQGWTGMYGSFVNQEGLIRSVTALEANGRITLKASNRVHTGKNSVTSSPISDTGDRKVVDESSFEKSFIDIKSDGTIEHYGQIIAPSGQVTLSAEDRVYLAEGSSIDVSGSWVALSGDDRMVEVQLNSKELRDAFIHKYGPLKGETITVDTLTGLSFADISDYLNSRVKSAPELTTKGGTILLTAGKDNGEVIVKQGANLDFSGGGLIYGDGLVQTTRVRIGQKIYDLADVPLDVPVDEVLGYHSRNHERYGITEEWEGMYYGGSSAYVRYLPSFTQGADAGKLEILARKTILDGSMHASVVRGIYQNALADPTDGDGNIIATGQAMPRGGSLIIGDTLKKFDKETNLGADAIVVKAAVSPTVVTADGALLDHGAAVRVSELSAERLNEAGLRKIELMANQSVTIAPEATLIAAGPEAKVAIEASRIEHHGLIRAVGGEVEMTIPDITPVFRAEHEGIFLADASRIDVSGQRMNNAGATLGAAYEYGLLDGGSVALKFNNPERAGEVVMARGALIDVSGGYSLEHGGGIKGGDAGTVSFSGQAVRPDGELRGLALEGNTGGELSIHTGKITVAQDGTQLFEGFGPTDSLPGDLAEGLVLAEDRFANTGFSRITLKSGGDLIVEGNVRLAPSSERLARPVRTMAGVDLARTDTVAARDELAGPTSLTLAAGQKMLSNNNNRGNVIIEQGASLAVAPQGEITLETAYDDVVVAGSLTAHGGTINLTATNSSEVLLASTARVDASGTALDDPEHSLPLRPLNRQVVAGGSVSLSGGKVVMEQGSRVNVSGSEAVTNTISDNKGGYVATTVASAPGSVSVTYDKEFANGAELSAKANQAGLPGGSLSITKTLAADQVGEAGNYYSSTMVVKEDDVTGYQAGGFDDLTFSSLRALEFSESETDHDQQVRLNLARRLTLNASEIRGLAGQDIRLTAPWLRLSNIVPGTSVDYAGVRISDAAVGVGTATLALQGEFIDIQGNVALSGFQQSSLAAERDIRLFDYKYLKNGTSYYSGGLRSGGDLSMQAAAIYPGMYHGQEPTDVSEREREHNILPSAFTVQAGNAQNGWKKITILEPTHPENRQAIYSAGGSLTLEGGDIEQRGNLAAPMGSLILKAHQDDKGATGRVFLADNSLSSTKGEAMTLYGNLDTEQWLVKDHTTAIIQKEVADTPPVKSVTIEGKEIIQTPGAVIDLSGNEKAGVFAYEFLPGFDGSHNPLAKEGRYVIMADNSVHLPGQAVYLEGSAGLPAGTYSLLPEEYAFMPGAKVIELTSTTLMPGEQRTTPAGYTMVAGYETVQGTAISSPTRQGYIVRDAEEVLSEGAFDVSKAVAGNGGIMSVSAPTTILAGSIQGRALPGYIGGTLQVAGQEIDLGSSKGLPDTAWWQAFAFDSVIDDANLANKLILDTRQISGQESGLAQLTLGDANTQKITMAADSSLNGIAQIHLTATDSVALGTGAKIDALGDDTTSGELLITAKSVTAGENSSLHASDLLQLNVDNLNAVPGTFKADLGVEHGTLGLAGKKIFVEPKDYGGSRAEGIYLGETIRKEFKDVDKVALSSKGELVFLGDVALEAGKDLTLDAARITVANNGAANTVTVAAGKGLRIQNSGATSIGDDSQNSNAIRFSAETITFGSGDAKLDNFKTVNFASSGETVFNGEGTLTADLDANGSLTMDASRFIATMTPEIVGDSLVFNPVNYTVDSKDGALAFSGNDAKQDTGIMAMPGNLTLKGKTIDLNRARFELPAGNLLFEATNNITMAGASILARGGAFNFPIQFGSEQYDNLFALSGGQVAMKSESGIITIDEYSEIDTSIDKDKNDPSATEDLEGGFISLAAGTGGVDLVSEKLKGDFFSMDTNTIGDFGKLARTLAAGGFARQISLRARTGDVLVGWGADVATEHFKLVADGGKIDVAGTVDASSATGGGTIEMYAEDDLNLLPGGKLLAKSTEGDGDGGQVFLASETGVVTTQAVVVDPELGPIGSLASLIDVSGSGSGQGGTVTYRVNRDKLAGVTLDGVVTGADQQELHAVKAYTSNTVTAADLAQFSLVTIPEALPLYGYKALDISWSALYGWPSSAIWNTVYPQWLALIQDNWGVSLTEAQLKNIVSWKTGSVLYNRNETKLTSGWLMEAKVFQDANAGWAYKDSVDLVSEVEIRSASDLTINGAQINLHDFIAAGVSPGVITFRAAGDLKMETNILDVPAGSGNPVSGSQLGGGATVIPVADGTVDSFDLNFVAGADTASADFMAVKTLKKEETGTPGKGRFIIGKEKLDLGGKVTGYDSKLIYSESGHLRFASAGDTVIAKALSTSNLYQNGQPMPGPTDYNIGTFDGDIDLRAGGSLMLKGGIIQSALGDIDVAVGSNLELNYSEGSTKYYGAIRTTGRAPLAEEVPEFTAAVKASWMSGFLDYLLTDRFWDYREGGNISISAGGKVNGSVAQPVGSGLNPSFAWDFVYQDEVLGNLLGLTITESPVYWGADYGHKRAKVKVAQDPSTTATHGIATMAGGNIRLAAGGDIYTQVGAFKQGTVEVIAGGDLDGRFLAMDGDLLLATKGSFGTIGRPDSNATVRESLVELGDSRATISALGNLELGMVRNPTLARLSNWNLSFSEETGILLNAALGDITLQGVNSFLKTSESDKNGAGSIIPATLEATAARDLRINSKLVMAPSATGNLSLVAGRDIDGPLDENASHELIMSDADPATIYGRQEKPGDIAEGHDPKLLHGNDPEPVVVKAGRDIKSLSLKAAKRAEITAQRDIRDLGYWGQNLHDTDVSLISAGRDIIQVPKYTYSDKFYMKQAGPGYLLVQAGNSLALGNSGGIQSTGHKIGGTAPKYIDNTGLALERDAFGRVKGADVGVIVGYDIKLSRKEFSDFFGQLNEKGAEYSRLMATGKEEDTNAAARLKAEMLADIIDPLLNGKQSGDGTITMTQSAMVTNSGQDDLNILAAGRMEVGTTVLNNGADSSVKGLQTFGGGNINVFSQDTINVNESRVVTNFGGNIFLVSNHGDLNAGRGSNTEVSSSAQGYIPVGGKMVKAYGAPGVGSGVRTLSYDPDGDGPIGKPEQGAAYLIAWEGVIDAGEAGISASDVILAATKVLNSENISFSGAGVGVPVTGAAGPSLGAMAGASTISDSAKAGDAMGMNSGNDLASAMAKVAENFNIKM